ncbi:MAG: hypothetical protein ACR2IV_23820 [Bryobacteraceae bacterium]
MAANWSSEAPPSLAAARKRIADLEEQKQWADAEIQRLNRYIEAVETLVNPSAPVAPSNGTGAGASPREPIFIGMRSPIQPSNPNATATGEIARQILLRNGGPLELDDMLQRARAFPEWRSNGDDRADKNRLYAAMHRADTVFCYTDDGWNLVERVQQ